MPSADLLRTLYTYPNEKLKVLESRADYSDVVSRYYNIVNNVERNSLAKTFQFVQLLQL